MPVKIERQHTFNPDSLYHFNHFQHWLKAQHRREWEFSKNDPQLNLNSLLDELNTHVHQDRLHFYTSDTWLNQPNIDQNYAYHSPDSQYGLVLGLDYESKTPVLLLTPKLATQLRQSSVPHEISSDFNTKAVNLAQLACSLLSQKDPIRNAPPQLNLTPYIPLESRFYKPFHDSLLNLFDRSVNYDFQTLIPTPKFGKLYASVIKANLSLSWKTQELSIFCDMDLQGVTNLVKVQQISTNVGEIPEVGLSLIVRPSHFPVVLLLSKNLIQEILPHTYLLDQFINKSAKFIQQICGSTDYCLRQIDPSKNPYFFP